MNENEAARNLAAAIIRISIQDYIRYSRELKPAGDERGNKSMFSRKLHREELSRFFKSEWYYYLCECLNIDDEVVKVSILKRQMEVKRRENAIQADGRRKRRT